MQINPKENFGTSTGWPGFEPMASSLALQCSNQLSYEDPPYTGSGPICWIHLRPWKEWNIEWWCELGKYKFKWKYDRRSGSCNLSNCKLTRKKAIGSNRLTSRNLFRVNLLLLKLQVPLRRSYLYLNLYFRSSHHHSTKILFHRFHR